MALRHGTSTRNLHLLFADKRAAAWGSTLTAIHLQRANRMPADSRFARLRIGEVAWRGGVHEPSHFARLFHKRFGHAPTAVPPSALFHALWSARRGAVVLRL